MQAMGVKHVQAALHAHAIESHIVEFERSTATSEQAADNIGCQLGQIVKSLGFMVNKNTPLLVLASGDQTIDVRKLATLLNVGRKKIRMMTAEQCFDVLGYSPGGVPPIAHRCGDIAVFLDDTLRRYDTVYAAGGAVNAIFPIELHALQAVTDGKYANLARE